MSVRRGDSLANPLERRVRSSFAACRSGSIDLGDEDQVTRHDVCGDGFSPVYCQAISAIHKSTVARQSAFAFRAEELSEVSKRNCHAAKQAGFKDVVVGVRQTESDVFFRPQFQPRGDAMNRILGQLAVCVEIVAPESPQLRQASHPASRLNIKSSQNRFSLSDERRCCGADVTSGRDRDVAVGSKFQIVEQRFEADSHLLKRAVGVRFHVVPEAGSVETVGFRMTSAESGSDVGSVSALI